jgi:hypothetical protein
LGKVKNLHRVYLLSLVNIIYHFSILSTNIGLRIHKMFDQVTISKIVTLFCGRLNSIMVLFFNVAVSPGKMPVSRTGGK